MRSRSSSVRLKSPWREPARRTRRAPLSRGLRSSLPICSDRRGGRARRSPCSAVKMLPASTRAVTRSWSSLDSSTRASERSHISVASGEDADESDRGGEAGEASRELAASRRAVSQSSMARASSRAPRLELSRLDTPFAALGKVGRRALAVARLVEVRRGIRAACSHAWSPSSVSSACPAAACMSRAASAVSASTTTSRTMGEVKRSALGPVCTRN